MLWQICFCMVQYAHMQTNGLFFNKIQTNPRLYYLLIVIFGVLIITQMLTRQTSAGVLVSMGIAIIVAVFVMLSFQSLHIWVDNSAIYLSYGVGMVKRTFPLTNISEVKPIRLHWYHGYGIRYTPLGTLYNIAGNQAVYINPVAGRPFLLGTDDPEGLTVAIMKAKQS
jgi:hypothetical protein